MQQNIKLCANIFFPRLHNVENYLTAISLLHGDVPNEAFAETAREFGGVEHRIEFVRELDAAPQNFCTNQSLRLREKELQHRRSSRFSVQH